MRPKAVPTIAIIVVVALVVLAVLYGPSIIETLLSMHRIPQH
jgi:hypothetical protein